MGIPKRSFMKNRSVFHNNPHRFSVERSNKTAGWNITAGLNQSYLVNLKCYLFQHFIVQDANSETNFNLVGRSDLRFGRCLS